MESLFAALFTTAGNMGNEVPKAPSGHQVGGNRGRMDLRRRGSILVAGEMNCGVLESIRGAR